MDDDTDMVLFDPRRYVGYRTRYNPRDRINERKIVYYEKTRERDAVLQ